jgi:hypothetical protein|tara:strand:+ start:702 stop:821 length:120 start_codon:yes stop_codon:yes gene_type:complete
MGATLKSSIMLTKGLNIMNRLFSEEQIIGFLGETEQGLH